MKRNKISSGFGFTNLFTLLLVLFIMLYTTAGQYRATIDKKLLTQSVKNVDTGNAADGYTYKSDFSDSGELVNAHIQTAIRIQEEGTVLLKNREGALPLRSDGDIKVTLFGIHSVCPSFSGVIGAKTATSQNVAFPQAFRESGYQVNPDMEAFYQGLAAEFAPNNAVNGSSVVAEQGYVVNEPGFVQYLSAPTASFAAYSDAAIVFFGRSSGESSTYYPGEAGIGKESQYDEGEEIFNLSKDERYVIEFIKAQSVFDKIIVVLNTSNVFSVRELENDPDIDAILWIGQIGNYGAYGLANLLNAASGKSPSGGLVDTFAVNNSLAPAAVNYGVFTWTNYKDIDTSSSFALRAAWYSVQNEGIYEGYRYYETRYFDSIVHPDSNAAAGVGTVNDVWNYDEEVVYPFGYGLSYTTFSEEILPEKSEIHPDGTSKIVVKVTNTGSVAGKDNVQLYVSLPYEKGQVEKSAIQLVGYGKTGEAAETSYFAPIYLEPGASEEIEITVERDYYASYDSTENDGAYILDAGDYYFAVGNGAHDALQNVLTAMGQLPGDAKNRVISATLDTRVVIDETAEGAAVSNKLQDMDINKYLPSTTVTLSRSDWAGTFPKKIVGLTATDDMIYLLKNDTYTLKTGEDTSMFRFGTKDVSDGKDVGYLKGATEYEDERFAEIIANMPLETVLGRVAMGYDSVISFTEIGAPIYDRADSPVGMLLQLGVKSYGMYEMDKSDPNYEFYMNNFPSSPVVAASFSHKVPEMEGFIFGNDAIWCHMTTVYAPAMNIHRTVFNGRNNEYYSEDPILSGYIAADFVKSAYSRGLACTVKHFAFNDSEVNREGVATFIDEQSARENELRGFQIVLEQGGMRSIMTAFNRAGLTYCSAHMGLIDGILRNEWAFKGFVLTDSVKSAAYSTWEESILAGTDSMLNHSPFNVDGKAWESCQEKYVTGDYAMMSRIYESPYHFLYAFANGVWLNGISSTTQMVRMYPWWEITLLTAIAVSAAGTILFGALTTVAILKERTKKEK